MKNTKELNTKKQWTLYGVRYCFNSTKSYEHHIRSFNKKMDEIRNKFS